MLGITGSTGAIGGRVAARLAERGIGQRLIVRDASRAPQLDGAEVVVASGYGDAAEMEEALRGVTTLYFVSGEEAHDRLEQHRTVARAAAAAGVGRIVYVSFLAAAPEATFTLARQHWATEQAIRDTGLAFTFLRSSMYADHMPYYAGAEGVIRGPAGNGTFWPVCRDDLADAAVAVLDAANQADEREADSPYDGRTFELTGPEVMTMSEVAERLSAATGREIGYVDETLDQARASRATGGAEAWMIEHWISSYAAVSAGELDVESDAVAELTGHPPRTLEQCLRSNPKLLEPLGGG